MATAVRLTITEAIASIARKHNGHTIPVWKLRRVLDAMESDGVIDIQRVANYRTIDSEDVSKIAGELLRLGYLPGVGDELC